MKGLTSSGSNDTKRQMKGSGLCKIMKSLDMGPSAFGKHLGVTHVAVSLWMRDKRKISLAMEKHIRRTAEELLEKAS